jgi:hypothetical protein
MNEVVVDGVVYVRIYDSAALIVGDPSGFWEHFDEKEREETRRKLIEHLVEVGHFMRKEDYEKEHSIYETDELFYGL